MATIKFEKKDNRTLLTWTMLFESRQYLERVVKNIGVASGFWQHAERFVSYLSQISSLQ